MRGSQSVLAQPAPSGTAPLQAIRLSAWALGLALLGALVYLMPVASAWLLGSVAIGLPVLWLVWRRPEVGLLAMSFFTAGLVPYTMLGVSVAGLRLYAADLTLLGLLALFVARGVCRKSMEIPRWSISGPPLAFAAFAAYSAVYAWVYQGVNLGLIVGELRPAAFCAGCVIAASMVERRQQFTFLLAGLFVLADLTAGVVILQQFLGSAEQLIPGMSAGSWQIDQVGSSGGALGTVRVVPPGHVLMYLLANVAFCAMLGPLRAPGLRALLALQSVYLGVGLLLTYTRGQWVASGIALLLASCLLPGAAKKRLGALLFVVAPMLALFVGLVGAGVVPLRDAGFAGALMSRASSILTLEEALSSDSLQWRRFEVESAIAALSEHPVLGVGVGNDYRPITLLGGEASGWQWELGGPSSLTRWVHNSYLYIAVKMGLPAIAMFLWFCAAFLLGGARTYRQVPDGPEKVVVLAVLCSFAGLLEWSAFEAHFMLGASMTTLGLMVGIVAAVGRRHDASMGATGEPGAASSTRTAR